MGLYGALVVEPSSGPVANAPVVLVSEIDPALNGTTPPSAFDMRKFAPKYTLLNGAAFPNTATLGSAAPGTDMLVRYVNAGVNYHSMSILGANQRIVADDGHALAQPYTVVAQTIGPGQTTDAVVRVPAAAAPGTRLTVFDGNLQLRNRNRRPANATASTTYGGAMAFITVGGTVGQHRHDRSGRLEPGRHQHDDQRTHQRSRDRRQQRHRCRILDRRRDSNCLRWNIRFHRGRCVRDVHHGPRGWNAHHPGSWHRLGDRSEHRTMGLRRRLERQRRPGHHRTQVDTEPDERDGCRGVSTPPGPMPRRVART